MIVGTIVTDFYNPITGIGYAILSDGLSHWVFMISSFGGSLVEYNGGGICAVRIENPYL
jgi:hypothetical protein